MAGANADKTPPESIQVAAAGGHVYVVRVLERGTHQNSHALKQYFEQQLIDDPLAEFILDLEHCASMDSTFMGVLAGTGVKLRQSGKRDLIVTNLNDHTSRLLSMLGLIHILDVRLSAHETPPPPPDEKFGSVETASADRTEKIRLMIEAHETLIDIDRGNEVKFANVLEHLNESLDRTQRRQGD